MVIFKPLAAPVLLACLFAALHAAGAAGSEMTDEEKERFLLNAEVVETEQLSVGITNSLRASLEFDGFRHDAQIQSVNVFEAVKNLPSMTVINFRDYWGFNVAAYRLDRLLDLKMVPVSVPRRYGGEEAAFTWWIDDVAMMERERYQKDISPPDRGEWNRQMYRARVFNELVFNFDPNLGNVLIQTDWTLRLIDYTRSFNIRRDLREPKNLVRIDRNLLARLRELDPDRVREACEGLLRETEIEALLARRDKIVEHFRKRVAELGDDAVLY